MNSGILADSDFPVNSLCDASLDTDSSIGIKHHDTKSRFYITGVFIALYSIMPIIDSLNGYLLKSGYSASLTLGDVYRVIILIVMTFFFLRRFRRAHLVGILIALAVGIVSFILHGVVGSSGVARSELSALVQWIFLPFLTLTIYDCICNSDLDRSSIDIVFDVMQWIAPLTILIPYAFGLGYSTYQNSSGGFIGYKAFYYATNAISLLLIALFSRSTYNYLKDKNYKGFIVLVLNGIALALIGTKSSLIILFLAFIIAVYCIYGDRFFQFIFRLIPIVLAISVVAYFGFYFFKDIYEPIILRSDYFSNTVYVNDTLGFLTTGRIGQIFEHWNLMSSLDPSLLVILFGMGDTTLHLRICEMDFVDVFFQFGLFGLMLLIVFIGYVVKVGYKSSGKFDFAFCMSLFFIVYSFVVGHVFTNAMSSMTVSLIFALAMTNSGSSESTLHVSKA